MSEDGVSWDVTLQRGETNNRNGEYKILGEQNAVY